MDNKKMKKAYMEVLEIINHLDKTDYEKIPKNVIKKLENNKDKEYKVKLRFDIPLDCQELLYETKVLLSIIHKNYLANEFERNLINEKIKGELGKEIIFKKKK